MLKVGSLFTGYGGLDSAVEAHYDARTVWTSDIDPGACKVIAHRMPSIPNLGDITQIDWARVEPVDIITGGSPCQDLSHAGKRAGMGTGTRSNLWVQMRESIAILRPRYVVWENVRGALSSKADSAVEPCPRCVGDGKGQPALRALGRVLGDLADLGYDASWHGLRAADVGAPHGRFRIFVVAADTERGGRDGRAGTLGQGWRTQPQNGRNAPADTDESGLQGRKSAWRRDLPSRGAPATPSRDGRHEGRAEPTRELGGPDATLSGPIAADAEGCGQPGISGVADTRRPLVSAGTIPGGRVGAGNPASGVRELGRGAGVAWGAYGPAIAQWERVLGRPPPAPTETGPKGGQRLSPRFVEWMMGLPAGWVTDVPGLTRNAQLKALGNGVVPQQAFAALAVLDGISAAA